MLRALIAVVLACALCAGGASARTGGGTPAVFVTLEGSSQVVGVDVTTGKVVARVRVPPGPRDVTSYGARHLLVVSPQAGAVTLVDAFRGRVLKVWRSFGRPVGVATGAEQAYVADSERSEVAVIDLATRRIKGRVAVRPEPRNLAAGDVVLVTHGDASRDLGVARVTWNGGRVRPFLHFPAGGAAEQISSQPDTAYAYVTYSEGGIGALDWGRERVRWRRSVGRNLAAIAVDRYHGRRFWVSDREAGAVVALSTVNGRVLRRLHGCPGAEDVAFVGTAWVVAACRDENALAIWSQRTWERRLVRIGGRPHGVAEVVLP